MPSCNGHVMNYDDGHAHMHFNSHCGKTDLFRGEFIFLKTRFMFREKRYEWSENGKYGKLYIVRMHLRNRKVKTILPWKSRKKNDTSERHHVTVFPVSPWSLLPGNQTDVVVIFLSLKIRVFIFSSTKSSQIFHAALCVTCKMQGTIFNIHIFFF